MQEFGTVSGPSNSLSADGILLSDWHIVGGGEAGHVAADPTDNGKHWKAISPDLTRDDKSKQQCAGGPITSDNTGVEF